MSAEPLGRLFGITLRAGSTAAVRAFVSKGVSLDARDPAGLTPLMIAAGRGHVECARLLMEAGCDLSAVDYKGWNALIHARQAGCRELAELLSIACACGVDETVGDVASLVAEPADAREPKPGTGLDAVEDGPSPPSPPVAAAAETQTTAVRTEAVLDAVAIGLTASLQAERRDFVETVPNDGLQARPPTPPALTRSLVSLVEGKEGDLAALAPGSDTVRLADFLLPAEGGFTTAIDRVGDSTFVTGAGGLALDADDWLEDVEPDVPAQGHAVILQAANLQQGITSFGPVSLGDDWSDTDLFLPTGPAAYTIEKLPDDLMDEASRVLLTAFLTGSAKQVCFDGLMPLADAEEAGRILSQMLGDAGLRWDAADDPWAEIAAVADVDEGSRSEASEWLDEFRDALVEAQRLPRGTRLVGGLTRLTREQEHNLFLVSGQALTEASLKMARSAEVMDAILAGDAAIRAGTADFGSISGLEVAAALKEEADDVEERVDVCEGGASGKVGLPEPYESAIRVIRRVRGNVAGEASAPLDVRAASSAIRQLALTHTFLGNLCDRLVGSEGAAEAVVAIRSALGIASRAHARLAEAHLPQVRKVARYYAGRGLEEDDLVQEGAIGLLRAIELFDPDRGFRFWTYAQMWVRQALSRAVADKGRMIRIPVHVYERCRRIAAEAESFQRETGREPTAAELATSLELPLLEVVRLLEWSKSTVVEERDHIEELEELARSRAQGHDLNAIVTAVQLHKAVRVAMRQLDARAERVLRMRFGFDLRTDHTLEEIGEQFGVTRERIRQIEAKALGKLHGPRGGRILRRFLNA